MPGQGKSFRDHVDFDVLGLTGGYVANGIEEYEGLLRALIERMSADSGEGLKDELAERSTDIADEPRTGRQAIVQERYRGVELVGNAKLVFVVHGRNEGARNAMFQFLRALGLEPIEWGKAVAWTATGTPHIGSILDRAFERAQAVIVLLTGDDLARLGTRYLSPSDPSEERTLTPQARPNVLFEAGLAFGRHPERTILVTLGRSRSFSDVVGLHVVRMDNTPERRQELASRLTSAGCLTDLVGRVDWLREGDFDLANQPADVDSAGAEPVGGKSSPSSTTRPATPGLSPLSELEVEAILSMLQSEYHETIASGLQRIADSAFRYPFEQDDAILSTVEQLTTTDNSSLRRLAFRGLGSILRAVSDDRQGALRERLIPRVIKGMKEEVQEVRQEAIETAAAIPDDRMIEALIGLLNVLPDDEASGGQIPPVAYPLRAFHDKKAQIVARLMKLSSTESDGRIRRRILKCIEEVQRQ